MSNNVRDNTERHRFELDADNHVAFSNYKRSDGLVRGLLDLARAQGLKVRAVCPFVQAYLDRHPEYSDLQA